MNEPNAPEEKNPAAGGSYLRHPVTGDLTPADGAANSPAPVAPEPDSANAQEEQA